MLTLERNKMLTLKQAAKLQEYYWLVLQPQGNDIYTDTTKKLLEEKFGVVLSTGELYSIAYGDFTIDVENVLNELKRGGVPEEEKIRALELVTEDLPEIFFCTQCNRYYSADHNDLIKYHGDIYCENCVEDYFLRCYECDEYTHEDDVIYDSNGDAYCPDCASEYLYYCNECGDYYIEENMIWDIENNNMCHQCFESSFYICDHCGSFVHSGDAFYVDGSHYCNECYEDHSIIHDWDYKPSILNFHGENERYLGVELEVDEGGRDEDNAQSVLDYVGENHAYCKYDGSLDNGFEVVTHPATLEYHMHHIDWEGTLQELRYLGYTSHDAGTCGLHVHMNRKGFGNTIEEQDLGISKVLFFIERHWDKVVKFSRRTYSQLDKWAARYLDDEPSHPEDVLEYAKGDMSRYRCVNLCNYSTVEIRVFRGSLVYETVMATLQFCDLMYDIAELPLEEVMDITWNDFKEMGSKYKEFTSYAERRGL